MLQMTNATVDQLFAQALQHHQAGRLPEAEALYRKILNQNPNHADTLHLLGAMACQLERFDAGIELITKAIAMNPSVPAYRSNLGEAYRRAGQLDRATIFYRQALALDSHFLDAYTNLGVCLLAMNKVAEARDLLAVGVRECPTAAPLYRHLGDACIRLQQHDQAIEAYRRAVQLDPSMTEAQFNLAGVLTAQGRPDEAIAPYQAVIARTPGDLAARLSLAQALANTGQPNEAYKLFTSIIERDPRHAAALEGVASLYRNGDMIDDAIRIYRQAMEIKPNDAAITANLAFALRDYGLMDEALDLLRRMLKANPTWPTLHSALIFTMILDPRISRAELEMEQERWNDFHLTPLAAKRLPHNNDPDPTRRLRIGYVSADLRRHPVGRFMMPLLANHDRTQVEVFCYSSSLRSDDETALLRQQSDHWRQVSAFRDDDMAALIRDDAIDILVDLNMHSIDNRLLVFARKPAPVQMTYLAYCGGTGLHTIDYRLTDRHIDPLPPPGDTQAGTEESARAFERILRLETYWCYAPPPTSLDVGPLPAKANGYITLGSFNYFSKVNPAALDAWARILREMPTARLMLHVPVGSRRAFVHSHFEQAGVAADRVQLAPRVPVDKYFEQYQLVDLALDTFAFAGGTTTCDALWMGVPVVTLAGQPTMSRGGASILSTLGLPELVAHNPDEYHRIAVELASDQARLAALRETLRKRMQESPLMDAPRFARDIERAYRTAWTTWCNGGREPLSPPAG